MEHVYLYLKSAKYSSRFTRDRVKGRREAGARIRRDGHRFRTRVVQRLGWSENSISSFLSGAEKMYIRVGFLRPRFQRAIRLRPKMNSILKTESSVHRFPLVRSEHLEKFREAFFETIKTIL